MEIYTDNSKIYQTVKTIPTKLNDLISSIITEISKLLKAPSSEEIININWSSITDILGTISIILILAIISAITLYILKAVALYTMAKSQNKDFAWLAFVPLGCLFTFGFVTEKTKIFGIEIDHPEFLLPSLIIVSCLPYVGCISTILFILAFFAMLYRIYQLKSQNFAVVLLILSVLIPILLPIILFSLRNK